MAIIVFVVYLVVAVLTFMVLDAIDRRNEKNGTQSHTWFDVWFDVFCGILWPLVLTYGCINAVRHLDEILDYIRNM